MTPTELDRLVSKTADTPGTKIGIAEVSRVRACIFGELARMPVDEALATVAACLKSAWARLSAEEANDDS